MKKAEELESMFGISAGRIADIDEAAVHGVLPGKAVRTVTGPGRPPIFDEPMSQVSFKEPESKLRAIDERASQLGIKRSDYLRQLVDNDLECVGLA